ncbi:hypothetical protein [Algoriphagus namhaensis]
MKNLFYKSLLLTIVFFIVYNSNCLSQAKVSGKLGRYQAMMEKGGYKLATPPVYQKLGKNFYFSLKSGYYRIMVVFDDNYDSKRFCIYPYLSDFSLICNDGGNESVYSGEVLGSFNKDKPYIELELKEEENLMFSFNREHCKAKECEWALLIYY